LNSPQLPHELYHVSRHPGIKRHPFAGAGVVETQVGGMEHDSLGTAGIGQGPAMQRAVVNMIAAQGRAALPQVNADLVRAAGLQAAFHERAIPQFLDDANMRYGPLAFTGRLRAATAAVATVSNDVRFDSFRFRLTTDQGQVAALDGMLAKLLAQVPLGLRRQGEDHQAAGVLVDAVDRPNLDATRRPGDAATRRPMLGKEVWQKIGEGLGEEAPATRAELGGFLRVAHGGQAGRLLHHHHLIINVANFRTIVRLRSFHRRSRLKVSWQRPASS
jgi:hypothetical protein